MDRFWLLTWTTYGTWLPGDDRGFVSRIQLSDEQKIKHNLPNTEYDAKRRGMSLYATKLLKSEPVRLNETQANELATQFFETASVKQWAILALAIMSNHVHIVVAVAGDPEPETILSQLKSYGSRALNRIYGRQPSGTWWTASGSRRKLPDEAAVNAGIHYVTNQEYALYVWKAADLE